MTQSLFVVFLFLSFVSCSYLVSPVSFTIANDRGIVNGNTNGIYGQARWNFTYVCTNAVFTNNIISYTFCTNQTDLNLSLLITRLELVQPNVITQTKLFSKLHTIFPGEATSYNNGCMYGTWNFSLTSIPAMNSLYMPQLWVSNNLFQLTLSKLYTDAHESFYITNVIKPSCASTVVESRPLFSTVQQITLKVDGDFSCIKNTTQSCNDFLDDMAIFLNVARSRLVCVSVTQGSIVYLFNITDPEQLDSSALTATQLADLIITEVADPNSAIQDILPGPVITVNSTAINTTTTTPPTTGPTTQAPTTEPTTLAPTTLPPTTEPTTLAPTTLPPTTLAPTTLVPTTLAPTTLPPTTLPPTTTVPTTAAPTFPPGYYNETHVFLLIGQSNEVGFGTEYNSALDNVTNPLILQLGQHSPHVGQFYLAADPLDHDAIACATCVGHGFSFAKAYVAVHPGVRVVLIPAASGGTGFTGAQWHVGDSLYNNAISQANLAMSLLTGNYTKFVAFLWDQGEADTGHGGSGFPMGREGYFDSMFQLIQGLKTTITGATIDTPFITFEFTPDMVATTAFTADVGAIIQAQGDVLNNIYRVSQPSSYVPTVLGSDPVTGNIHYSAAAQRELGKRCNQTLAIALSQPTLPSTLQPVLSFNVTVYSTFVELEWSRVPYATGYRINELLNASIQLNITYINYKLHAIIPNLTPSSISYTFIIKAMYIDASNNIIFSSSSTNVSTSGLPILTRNNVTAADWKIDFSTGSPVNIGSKSYIVPILATGGGTVTYPSDSTRRHTVAQLANGAHWDMGPNSSVPLSYTKTFWINQPSNADGNIISTSIQSNTPTLHVVYISNKRVTSYHGGYLLTLRSTVDIIPNTWAFYAITFDSTTRLSRLYMNGIFMAQRYLDLPPSAGGAFDVCDLGSAYQWSSYTFAGKLDYPSVYPVVLSPGQVYSVFASEL